MRERALNGRALRALVTVEALLALSATLLGARTLWPAIWFLGGITLAVLGIELWHRRANFGVAGATVLLGVSIAGSFVGVAEVALLVLLAFAAWLMLRRLRW